MTPGWYMTNSHFVDNISENQGHSSLLQITPELTTSYHAGANYLERFRKIRSINRLIAKNKAIS